MTHSIIELGARTSISPSEITYLEGDYNYTLSHTSNGKCKVYSITMKRILESIDKQADFIRISKKYAVNIRFVKCFRNKKVHMIDGKVLQPSRRSVSKVKSLLIS